MRSLVCSIDGTRVFWTPLNSFARSPLAASSPDIRSAILHCPALHPWVCCCSLPSGPRISPAVMLLSIDGCTRDLSVSCAVELPPRAIRHADRKPRVSRLQFVDRLSWSCQLDLSGDTQQSTHSDVRERVEECEMRNANGILPTRSNLPSCCLLVVQTRASLLISS